MAWKRYPTKYGNKKTYAYGIKFDSKHEAERYIELRQMQERGMIKDLELQKKYVLLPAQHEMAYGIYVKGKRKGQLKQGKLIEKEVAYYADFDYFTSDGEHVVEDAKGVKTKEYVIKRKLMLWVHNIRIKEV